MSMQAEIGKHNDVSIQFYNLSKVHHSQINKERVEGDIQFVAKIFDDNSESRELVLLLRMWESKLLHSDSFETAKEVLEKHKESAKADTEKYGALINALETC
ncbi:hypothetical protein COEREDRAFT_88339 [Coemansia reversa NRRL 1564]|uniref:Uncharacterized protein n=1 Tax=Coemansia reversa (strain ATCC 12441 / NRRL 1564) TaxID=763665 RepID=A0A2G5B720_COERN|nr:hypothetical protein COEREDRAFT_88339 [Coemansia reversa NRRL 1564]|eukprot:PIA14808.1 hypothetical protein COEREDRAFT_88339 [Coemansia reversa NRRL 1564]